MDYQKKTRLKLKLTGIALAGLMSTMDASALGLGTLKVESNLDQPLNAVIELQTSINDNLDTLTASIAAEKEFEKLGIPYAQYLKDIELTVDKSAGKPVLKIVSNNKAINEPFIHFLVKVNWSGGSFLREYTALLSPPVYAQKTPQSIAQPVAVGGDVAKSGNRTLKRVVKPKAEQPKTIDSKVKSDVVATSAAGNAQYGPVERGETLSQIAAELQQQFSDLSMYQIINALFEENRSSFIGENINGLKAGVTLSIADLGSIREIDIAQAKQFFSDQVNSWNTDLLLPSGSSNDGLRVGQDEYVNQDTDIGSSTVGIDALSNDSGSADFKVGASTDIESLVSNGSSSAGEVTALQQQIVDLETTLNSKSLENQELSERISLLEGQLADMNQLLNVDNADLASVQANLAERNDSSASVLEDVVEGSLDEIADGSLEEIADGSVASELSDSSDEAVESIAVSKSVSVYQEPSAFDKIQSAVANNGLWPMLTGLGALLLGGIGFLLYRRREADEEFEISMMTIDSKSKLASFSEAEKGGESSFLFDYSESDALEQAGEVDPIAEADVYIAYGRDEQAEEVLLAGIKSKPERLDIKSKLLTLYHKNRNVEGFEQLSEELYSQKAVLTPEVWNQVSRMGKDLSPENPLYNVDGDELLANADTVDAPSVTEIDESSQTVESTATVPLDESEVTIAQQASSVTEMEKNAGSVKLLDDEQDASVHLIDFDEGLSEVSELDAVDINSNLVLNADHSDDFDAGGTTIDINDELDAPLDLDSSIDFEISDLELDESYDEARTQYELAKVFVDLGDEDGARKILNELVSNKENSKEILTEAADLLASLEA